MSNEENKNKPAASGAFGAATGKDALVLLNPDSNDYNPDIVNYQTTDATRRAAMDEMIAIIDAAIENDEYSPITTFDKAPSDKLGATSDAILREVQSANSFLGSFREFSEKLKDFDFEGIGEMAKDYSATIARKMKLAAIKNPILRIVKKAIGWITGFGHTETTGEKLRHEIDKSILQFGEVIADLEDAKEKIPGVAKNLDIQEDARIEAYSDYGLYIGAALESYRRWKEEKLPALEAQARDSKSLLDSRNVRAKTLGLTVLNKKLTAMDTFHKSCLVQLETIEDLKGALAMCALNIDGHLTTSQNEWKAFLSEATSAATLSEIAEANQQADQFGDEIFKQAQSLSDLTKEMSRACFEHGTLDAGLVAQFLDKKAKMVIEDVEYIKTVNEGFEAKRALLDQAAERLFAAKAQVSDIGAAKEAQKLLENLDGGSNQPPATGPSGDKPQPHI